VKPPEVPVEEPNNGAINFAAFANSNPDCLAEIDDMKGILVT
jgi:hypothetical protein